MQLRTIKNDLKHKWWDWALALGVTRLSNPCLTPNNLRVPQLTRSAPVSGGTAASCFQISSAASISPSPLPVSNVILDPIRMTFSYYFSTQTLKPWDMRQRWWTTDAYLKTLENVIVKNRGGGCWMETDCAQLRALSLLSADSCNKFLDLLRVCRVGGKIQFGVEFGWDVCDRCENWKSTLNSITIVVPWCNG